MTLLKSHGYNPEDYSVPSGHVRLHPGIVDHLAEATQLPDVGKTSSEAIIPVTVRAELGALFHDLKDTGSKTSILSALGAAGDFGGIGIGEIAGILHRDTASVELALRALVQMGIVQKSSEESPQHPVYSLTALHTEGS